MRGEDCWLFCPAVRYCEDYAANRDQFARTNLVDVYLTRRAAGKFSLVKPQTLLDQEIQGVITEHVSLVEASAYSFVARAEKIRELGKEIMGRCTEGVLIEPVHGLIECQSDYPHARGFTHDDYVHYRNQLPQPPNVLP